MDQERRELVSKIDIAIIGAGYWGYKLIKEYLALKERYNIKLRAVVDISQERLEKVSRELGIPRSRLYTDYKKVLEDPDIEAVHIATPNETHFPIARDMIEAGKNVLLEKPMALSSSDAFKLVRLAEINGSVLLVGHIFRFNNALYKVRQLLHERLLGELYYFDLVWTTKMPPPPKRDIIFDLAPHPIDIINFLIDEWPSETYVKAKSYVRKKRGLEEVAYALMELHKGLLAHIKLSWLEYGRKTRTIKITGEEGVIKVDALRQGVIYIDEQNNELEIHVTPNNTIRDMILHFIEVIKGNKSPSNSALIGALTIVVLEAMRESLKRNIPITILR